MTDELKPLYDPACGLTYHQWYRKSSPHYLAKKAEYREKDRLYAQRRYNDPSIRETLKEACRTYSKTAKAKRAKKRWYDKNGRAYARAWYEKHAAKRIATQTSRYQTDVHVRLLHVCRRRVSGALKAQRVRKDNTTQALIGCTIPELQRHLEEQFQPGMSWETYGSDGWHVDHIRPRASFDLADFEQLLACFHYTNLQPLWAAENVRKGARWQPSCSGHVEDTIDHESRSEASPESGTATAVAESPDDSTATGTA